MNSKKEVQHVYLVGAKSLGAYGGYETFVYKLTEYHQNKENIKYHVACKANGDGCMDESKFEGVTKINDHEFEFHNAHCFKIDVPQIGAAQAIYYDVAALKACCEHIFVALPMYAVHCVLAGLSFMLMHILNVGVGMTFSGGLIDLVLFGVMQGNAKTHWMWVVVVGAVYFVLYYIIFRFMISKFDYKTPGRDDAEEVKLYTRADVNARSAASGSTAPAGDDPVSALIVDGLGGANNLSDVDCCATRLRCTVKDAALVRQDVLKASGASGVICKGNGVQVVYGPKVAVIKAKLEDYLENAPKTPAATTTPAPAAPAAKDTVLSACLNGTVVPLADVKDEAFASGALGDGIAIEPTDGELVAPADGEISSTFETHHAVGMTTADGAELLMHIGIDTVKLGGKHFTYLVNEGDKVKKGQPLIRFELEAIKAEGYPVTTPLIVCNTDDYAAVAAKASGAVKQGDALLELKH